MQRSARSNAKHRTLHEYVATSVCLDKLTQKDFRKASNLVASITPTRGAGRAEKLTSKNVQRGLAQKIQEASGQFRVKQRVYMQSELAGRAKGVKADSRTARALHQE